MANAHQYSCSACAFQVRSENTDEVVELVKDHAMGVHDLSMSDQEIQDGMQDVTV